MALHPTTILTPFLVLLSLYAAQKSYIAIINLQQNEERTEKAAKHLDRAAHDLYKTRVTQASGAAAVRIHLSHQCSHIALFSKVLAWIMDPPFILPRPVYSPPITRLLFYRFGQQAV